LGANGTTRNAYNENGLEETVCVKEEKGNTPVRGGVVKVKGCG